jgi:hypothetical protein
MFNKPNSNENNFIDFDCSKKLENDKNINEEFNLLYHITDPFSIRNGLLGVNRIIFLKLLKCLKFKDENKIRAV